MHAPQMSCGRRWPDCAHQATVEHVEAAAAVATEHSGHAAGSEVQFVDERVAGGGADVAAHSVPPRRPCSVGWRGATVLCTRALRDAEWARLTAAYRDSNPNVNPNPSPSPSPNLALSLTLTLALVLTRPSTGRRTPRRAARAAGAPLPRSMRWSRCSQERSGRRSLTRRPRCSARASTRCSPSSRPRSSRSSLTLILALTLSLPSPSASP